jgi:hypothetical protein
VLAFTGAVVVAGSLAVSAQSPLEQRLINVKSVKCVFPVMATGTWKATEPAAEVKPSKLSIVFDEIVVDEGTARAVGTFGPADIIVRLSSGNLHLVQSFRDGPLYVTTILPKETRPGQLQAVHSRHEYTLISLPGFTSRPEQYYGECELIS